MFEKPSGSYSNEIGSRRFLDHAKFEEYDESKIYLSPVTSCMIIIMNIRQNFANPF